MSARKVQVESRINKGTSDSKLLKYSLNTQELRGKNEFLPHPMTSVEPKDVSDRTLAAFESYLSQVTSMYFGNGINLGNRSLNEVSSRLCSNQNGLLMPTEQQQVADGSSSTEEGGNTGSNDFHYSTLDVLCNPLRLPHVFENWSPREIAIFET